MLSSLQIQWKQKVGLIVLFSLAAIGIVLDILRTVVNLNATTDADALKEVVYNVVELELAVIISTLIAYRSLFSTQRNRSTSDRITPQGQRSRYLPMINADSKMSNDHKLHFISTSHEMPGDHESFPLKGSDQHDATATEEMVWT